MHKRKSTGTPAAAGKGGEDNNGVLETRTKSLGNDIVTLQSSLLARPARKQSTHVNSRYEDHDVDTQEYNIWYHKKLGKRNWRDRDVSDARCSVLKDCGRTRAAKDAYFCLHFARGRCVNGVDCTFLHRVPTPEDDKRLELTYDIFGRERFRSDRDDMGGVGSFSRDNRRGLKSNQNAVALEDMLRRGFEEWGILEYVRVILSKSIAFVRFVFRSSAEFAKEAMADQTLDNGELLNVRWATEDSNMSARAADDRNLHRVATEVVNKRLREMMPDDHSALQFQMTGQYPNTDAQFDPSLAAAETNQLYQYQYNTSKAYEMHPYAAQYNKRLSERQKSGEGTDIEQFGQVGNYYGHEPNHMNNMTEDQKKQYDDYLKSYYEYYGYDYAKLTDEQKQQLQQYSQTYYGANQPAAAVKAKEDDEEEEEDDDYESDEEEEKKEERKESTEDTTTTTTTTSSTSTT
eukprot:gene12832-15064_t